MFPIEQSEIMNNFSNKYVYSKTTLEQFFEQYKNALKDK